MNNVSDSFCRQIKIHGNILIIKAFLMYSHHNLMIIHETPRRMPFYLNSLILFQCQKQADNLFDRIGNITHTQPFMLEY